jgi:hypothetical protein
MALGVRDMPMYQYEDVQNIPMHRYIVNSHNADSRMEYVRKSCYNSMKVDFEY